MPLEHAREDTDRIGLAPLRGEARGPGPTLVEPGLDIGLGERDDAPGGGPQKVGVPIVDLMTGMYAAQAVLAALYRREKTGQGRLIDMALYDCGVMITGWMFGVVWIGGAGDSMRTSGGGALTCGGGGTGESSGGGGGSSGGGGGSSSTSNVLRSSAAFFTTL